MRTRSLSVPLVAVVAMAALAWYLFAERGVGGDGPGSPAPVGSEDPRAPQVDAAHRGAEPVQQARGAADAGPGISRRPAGTVTGSDVATGAPRHASLRAGTGPRALSSEGAQRIDSAVADYRGQSTDFDDMQYLLENEARDDAWADATEARIAAFLEAEAGGYSGLEVAPPRCSATVCRVAATALPGLDMEAPEANWQMLMSAIYGQPWFAATFIDTQMLVTHRDGAAVYIGTFLRKPD